MIPLLSPLSKGLRMIRYLFNEGLGVVESPQRLITCHSKYQELSKTKIRF